jgi:hypothetical protein
MLSNVVYDSILSQKLCDSLPQFSQSLCCPVGRYFTVDVSNVIGRIPDAQTEFAGCQLIILAKVQPLTPTPVDEQIPLSFGFWCLRSVRVVNRIIAQTINIVAAGKADIVSSQLDTEADITICQDFPGYTVNSMAVRMGKKLPVFFSQCCHDVNEVMGLDYNHVCSLLVKCDANLGRDGL